MLVFIAFCFGGIVLVAAFKSWQRSRETAPTPHRSEPTGPNYYRVVFDGDRQVRYSELLPYAATADSFDDSWIHEGDRIYKGETLKDGYAITLLNLSEQDALGMAEFYLHNWTSQVNAGLYNDRLRRGMITHEDIRTKPPRYTPN